jgi:hypothetical protein
MISDARPIEGSPSTPRGVPIGVREVARRQRDRGTRAAFGALIRTAGLVSGARAVSGRKAPGMVA